MKILLTGANGYIGKRLLPVLVEKGYGVVCCVRDRNRFNPPQSLLKNIEILEVDFLDQSTLDVIPQDIDGAYFLIHSMSTAKDYDRREKISAIHFREAMNRTGVKHVVYLSGIVNEKYLSKHLASRKAVEDILAGGNYRFTALRAGIIIGAGSASFEIIRDLVEKLPLMITPKWLNTRCQPIGIRDVIDFLSGTLFHEGTYDRDFDIGGPDILTYKEMLLGFAKARALKRYIITLPVLTPRLSSYWLFFIASTSFRLAFALVDSMKVKVICRNTDLNRILGITPAGYTESLQRTLTAIEDNTIVSSWKDALVSGRFNMNLSDFLAVPTHGCFRDLQKRNIPDYGKYIENLWKIGGKMGWYYGNIFWKIRGFLDQLSGGVGLRRGRSNPVDISPGDAIDFWRVLYANKKEGRLLLFAEMKLPGEAWLEFRAEDQILYQTATFRPRGLLGRFYWYALLPVHSVIFRGMARKIAGS